MSNELAIFDPGDNDWLKSIGAEVACSFDTVSREGKLKLIRCMQSEDFKADDLQGSTFAVQDVVVHRMMILDDKTGEMKPILRTVLIGPDGSRIACASEGVIRSLTAISVVCGPPPWIPPMVCVLKEAKSKAGRRYFVLEPTV